MDGGLSWKTKPYFQMDDLGGQNQPPLFLETPSWSSKIRKGAKNPEDQSVSYLLLGVILGALGFIIAVPVTTNRFSLAISYPTNQLQRRHLGCTGNTRGPKAFPVSTGGGGEMNDLGLDGTG